MDYNYLTKYYNEMYKMAVDIIKNKKDYEHDCGGKKECASCLAAYVRTKIDYVKSKSNNELGFGEGDMLMIDLRNEIAEKFDGWFIN